MGSRYIYKYLYISSICKGSGGNDYAKQSWENYNLLLPLARFGQLAKCVQCYIGQICPSIHWTDLAIDKWHNMSTHRKDLILLFLLPSSFPPPSLLLHLHLSHPLYLSLTCYMLQWLVYSITLHTLHFTWLPLSWVRFEPMTLGCEAAALTNRPQRRSHSYTIKLFYLCQISSICY